MPMNVGKLTVDLRLGRNVYLPGERICATVLVKNATTEPLEALPPFGYRAEEMEILIRRPEITETFGSEWFPRSTAAMIRGMVDHPALRPRSRTLVMQPNEVISDSVWLNGSSRRASSIDYGVGFLGPGRWN